DTLGLGDADDEAVRECAEVVLLIVSELVTNACRHSPGPVDLRITWNDHVLTVEVDDRGEGVPVLVDEEDRGAGGGFGMGLIDALADGWGVEPQGDGKTVYVRIAFP
ncbi:ATP-binding protein, partial [Streptomyces massasporeus]|uniref:ATP-binding protein n=1 Tax=Streptomyces massasporeus TaxID=67324 RepID=UPI0036A424E6